MDNLRDGFQENGFVRLNGFFAKEDVEAVRQDATWVFLKQMTGLGFMTAREPDDGEIESG